MPVQQLPGEIRELGYQGSSNLLVRTSAKAGSAHLSPRRAARLLLTRPASLTADQRKALAAYPEMATLADLISSFAALLTPNPSNAALL